MFEFDFASGSWAPTAAELLAAVEGLASSSGEAGTVRATDRECVDRLEVLERLKSACAAAQARITDDLDQRARSRPVAPTDHGLGAQVGLARRESPHRGRTHLRLARALVHDLPRTLAALERGDLDEHSAQIIADETRDLSRDDRRRADAELAAGCGGTFDGLGGVKLREAVRAIALRLDERTAVRRRARALRGRRVTGRLLEDGTAQVTAVVADWQYAAVMASLSEAADSARAAGDERTRGQVLADTAVARLTGQVTAQTPPVALNVVVSAETLLGDDSTPAHVDGVGPVPASVTRRLVATSPEVRSSIRRLFACPSTGALVAMESRRDKFPLGLKTFIGLRDRLCRTPWCGAPVRHVDHPVPRRAGGPSTALNGQGLCEACNYAKESPGWRQRPVSGPVDPHTVEITTPTGHTYRSRAPGLPRRTIEERIAELARDLKLIA